MSHKHIGKPDEACDGCIREAHGDRWKWDLAKTIAGLILLIGLVIVSMYALSKHLG